MFPSAEFNHSRPVLRGNAPENHGRDLLDGFQALAQKSGVSLPELNVVSRTASCLKPYSVADHECHSLRFGLPNLLGGQSATVAAMQHLMRDLMGERGELLGGLHLGPPCNL